jgi:Calpain family cysteine protease/RTX calcium-binding nonapeptide repeat (4 copies)
MNRRYKPPTKLQFDALEAREVPATAVLTGGSLLITGTEGGDTIRVRQSATAITVDGVSGSFPLSQVTTVRVNGLGGNDAISLHMTGAGVTKPAVVLAGSGDDSVWGGLGADYIDGETGDDQIFGDAGADKIAGDTGADVLTGGDGNDSIAGGDGNDIINGGTGVDHMWGGAGFDVISGGAGHDHVYDDLAFWAVQVNDTDYVHHHILGFADNSGFGWFDANMSDGDLRREARASARNNFLGRAEMISLFEQATDGADVNNNEFNSLKNLVNTDQVNFDAPSRFFGQKIMNGDSANQWFTGGGSTRHALGNLSAGDTDDHLQKLIDKWFLGKDQPMAKNDTRTTTFGYQEAKGQLFVGGASANDIDQGDVGDCYFMAGLGAIARKDAARITNMFTDNGDGTYTVRLFHDGKAEYVTVDKCLPVDDHGFFEFANNSSGKKSSDPTNELWVALAEKAYAQFNESGWIEQDGTNSYNGVGGAITGTDNSDGINGGHSDTAMRQIAGVHTDVGPTATTSFADIRAKFDAGKAVTFSTGPLAPPDSRVVSSHVYIMTGYNATTKTITLRNPWAGTQTDQPAILTLSYSAVQSNFLAWASADV